jgi:predicted SAM-dependent methyltransferase
MNNNPTVFRVDTKIKNFLRQRMSLGLYESIKIFLRELMIYIAHRKGVRRAYKITQHKGMKLNMGCGSDLKPGWINIDINPIADLTLDLREPLPFKDNTCSEIYCEHFLEHLEYPEPAYSFLKECYRVLEPGRLLSIGVPDTEWPLLEYAGVKNEGYFRVAKKIWHPLWCETELEHINYHFRQTNEHRFAYDFTTLKHALLKTGFINIKRRQFTPHLDNEQRNLGTLYVDSVKPSEEL